jgi:hypothetical protein
MLCDIAVVKLEKQLSGAVPATPGRRSHRLGAPLLAAIGYNGIPKVQALRRMYPANVDDKLLYQKAMLLAPEHKSAAVTTHSVYGEIVNVDLPDGTKRSHIVRNAHGVMLAYHLSMLSGSSGSMVIRGDEWVGKEFSTPLCCQYILTYLVKAYTKALF